MRLMVLLVVVAVFAIPGVTAIDFDSTEEATEDTGPRCVKGSGTRVKVSPNSCVNAVLNVDGLAS